MDPYQDYLYLETFRENVVKFEEDVQAIEEVAYKPVDISEATFLIIQDTELEGTEDVAQNQAKNSDYFANDEGTKEAQSQVQADSQSNYHNVNGAKAASLILTRWLKSSKSRPTMP